VAQGDRLGQGHVDPTGASDGGGDLRNLESMGEAGAEVVGREDEDLRLAGQAPEGSGVEDAVAVALEAGAVGVVRFGDPAVAGTDGAGRKGR
jgi:hypothetical protein